MERVASAMFAISFALMALSFFWAYRGRRHSAWMAGLAWMVALLGLAIGALAEPTVTHGRTALRALLFAVMAGLAAFIGRCLHEERLPSAQRSHRR